MIGCDGIGSTSDDGEQSSAIRNEMRSRRIFLVFLFHQLWLITEWRGFRRIDWLTLWLLFYCVVQAAIQPQFLISIRLTGPDRLPRNQWKLFPRLPAHKTEFLRNLQVVVAQNLCNSNFPTSQLLDAIMESTLQAQIDGNNWMPLTWSLPPLTIFLSWINKVDGNRQVRIFSFK